MLMDRNPRAAKARPRIRRIPIDRRMLRERIV